VSHLDWHARAACRTADPELFFTDGQGGGRGSADKAKAVCAGCPVTARCLRDALSRDLQHGIWGGTTADERREMRRSGAVRG